MTSSTTPTTCRSRPVDGAYIAYYPLQVTGLVLLIRRRTPGRDWAALVDAMIITVGFGLLSWIYLIEPYTRDGDDGLLSRVVSAPDLGTTVTIRIPAGHGGELQAGAA